MVNIFIAFVATRLIANISDLFGWCTQRLAKHGDGSVVMIAAQTAVQRDLPLIAHLMQTN